MLNTQLIIGIIINLLTNLSPSIPDKNSIIPKYRFKKYYLIGFLVGMYYVSFLIIIFSSGNTFINIGICLLLHFLINPALLEWKREEKNNPLHLDQDTLDQIKLEKEGHYVGWKDGKPIVLHKKSNNQKIKL